jgi:hypothetical protein
MRKPHWRLVRQKHDIRNFATANVWIPDGIPTLGVIPTTQGRHTR